MGFVHVYVVTLGCYFLRVIDLLKGSAEHVMLTVAKGAAQSCGVTLNQPPSPRYPGRKDLEPNVQYGKYSPTCMEDNILVEIT